MATDANRMVPGVQAVANLRRLGLEHVMMLSSGAEECMTVAGHLPRVGCVWSEFLMPIFGADKDWVAPAIPQWHNRCRKGGV